MKMRFEVCSSSNSVIEWRRDSSSHQEELWRSLRDLRGTLSQWSSDKLCLMDNISSLAEKVELYKTEMEAVTSGLKATVENLTSKME